MDIDVNILIDRGRNQKSLVFPVIGGQVRAAPAQGDTKW
jgi:hypothetical protein